MGYIAGCRNFTLNVTEGRHNISICVNTSNEANPAVWNCTELRNFTSDLTAPTISIGFPTSGYNFSSNENITLNFTYSDALGINLSSCNYSTDANGTGFLLSNCANTTFNVTGEGAHNITISVKDNAGHQGNATLISFRVGLTSPYLSATYTPADNYNSAAWSQTFTFTPYSIFPTINCYLIVDGSTVETTTTAANGTETSLTHIFGAQQSYNWNITCTDPVSRSNSTANRRITITALDASPSTSSKKTPSLDSSFDCATGKLTVTAMAGGDTISGLTLKLFNKKDITNFVSKQTDSDGKAVFTITSAGNYDVDSAVGGQYLLSSISLALTPCSTTPAVTPTTTPTTPVVTQPTTTPTTTPPVTPPAEEKPAVDQAKTDATVVIEEARIQINLASNSNKDTAGAQAKFDAANAALLAGEYELAKALANEAIGLAKSAAAKKTATPPATTTTPAPQPAPAPAKQQGWDLGTILLVLVVLVVVIVGIYYLTKKKKYQ
jgi:hypothetical protein